MASSSNSTDTKLLPLHRKKIKVRKLMNDSSSNSSSISLEENNDDYIPLAARDSKWVGLNMCNSDLLLYSDYEANDEEVVIMEVNEEEELPIYSLFPSLRNTPPEKQQLVSSNESTADITKLLVGQKPDFTHMKKSKRFSPVKLQQNNKINQKSKLWSIQISIIKKMSKRPQSYPDSKSRPDRKSSTVKASLSLPKLEEVPNEEKVSEAKLSKLSSRTIGTPSFINRGSDSSNSSKETHYDDEGELDNKKVKKRKIYKKRAIPLDIDTESSYSGINQTEKRTVKTPVKNNSSSYNGTVQMQKRTSSVDAKTSIKVNKNSSNGSLADEESSR